MLCWHLVYDGIGSGLNVIIVKNPRALIEKLLRKAIKSIYETNKAVPDHCCLMFSSASGALALDDKPNIVVIFTDDQGYGDLGCFGGKHVSTPRIDRMATEGAKLTSFYVAGPVCTPSRAGLMTGCYPKRIDMATEVLLASGAKGLNPQEVTIHC